MNGEVIFWLVLSVILGTIETLTSNLITIWPTIAAVVVAFFAGFGMGQSGQAMVFIVLSAILLIATRPLVKNFIKKKTVPTNADRIIGSFGVVVQEINSIENTGQVKVAGQIWSAKEKSGKSLPEGAKVLIDGLEGVKVIVSEICED